MMKSRRTPVLQTLWLALGRAPAPCMESPAPRSPDHRNSRGSLGARATPRWWRGVSPSSKDPPPPPSRRVHWNKRCSSTWWTQGSQGGRADAIATSSVLSKDVLQFSLLKTELTRRLFARNHQWHIICYNFLWIIHDKNNFLLSFMRSENIQKVVSTKKKQHFENFYEFTPHSKS